MCPRPLASAKNNQLDLVAKKSKTEQFQTQVVAWGGAFAVVPRDREKNEQFRSENKKEGEDSLAPTNATLTFHRL